MTISHSRHKHLMSVKKEVLAYNKKERKKSLVCYSSSLQHFFYSATAVRLGCNHHTHYHKCQRTNDAGAVGRWNMCCVGVWNWLKQKLQIAVCEWGAWRSVVTQCR